MIEDERQYRITQIFIGNFESYVHMLEDSPKNPAVDARLHQAELDGAQSQLDDLREQITVWEQRERGTRDERYRF